MKLNGKPTMREGMLGAWHERNSSCSGVERRAGPGHDVVGFGGRGSLGGWAGVVLVGDLARLIAGFCPGKRPVCRIGAWLARLIGSAASGVGAWLVRGGAQRGGMGPRRR